MRSEIDKLREEVKFEINSKVELEGKYKGEKAMVAQLEGILKDSYGFRRLEEIVEKLHSTIALNSCDSLSDPHKDLIHQLFKVKPGQFEGLNQSLAEMKTENAQLHI